MRADDVPEVTNQDVTKIAILSITHPALTYAGVRGRWLLVITGDASRKPISSTFAVAADLLS